MCIDKARSEGNTRVIVLSFYAAPDLVTKIKGNEDVPVYVLTSSAQLKTMKSMVLNETSQYKTPTATDYESSVMDQLLVIYS